MSDDDVNTAWLKDLRKAAEGGDPNAAERLIEICRDTIADFTYPNEKFNIAPQIGEAGRVSNIHPEVAEYLHGCFDLYLKGVEIGMALGINTGVPGGREIENITGRNINICAELWQLTKDGVRYKHEIVAERYELSSEYVRRQIWGDKDLKAAGEKAFELDQLLSKSDEEGESLMQERVNSLKKKLAQGGFQSITHEDWKKIVDDIWSR